MRTCNFWANLTPFSLAANNLFVSPRGTTTQDGVGPATANRLTADRWSAEFVLRAATVGAGPVGCELVPLHTLNPPQLVPDPPHRSASNNMEKSEPTQSSATK